MDLHDGSPFWPTRDGLPNVFPPLPGDIRTDVVVVGGGITGALVALELTDRGHEVVVIDRRHIATGSTSASTAMLQYEIDELLIDLADAYGEESAMTCYQECGRAIDLVRRAAEISDARCGFRMSPSVYVATGRRSAVRLQEELDARKSAGFEVAWLGETELYRRWGLVGTGAIESALGASVDPYALAHAALALVSKRGSVVADRTEVTHFETTARRVRLTTGRGTITAKWCVIATGYEVTALLPSLRVGLHSTFAFASEPVAGLERTYPDGLLFWEHADPYLYGRTTDDGRVLIGGRDEPYRDPRRRGRAIPSKIRALRVAAERRLPRIALEPAFSWAGTFAVTPDGLPYIGLHRDAPRCLFALGFGGNGITYSALAAEYLADAIAGSMPEAAKGFRLDRSMNEPRKLEK